LLPLRGLSQWWLMRSGEGKSLFIKPGPPVTFLLNYWVRAKCTLNRKIPVASGARTWDL